jgi:hypothetical protein
MEHGGPDLSTLVPVLLVHWLKISTSGMRTLPPIVVDKQRRRSESASLQEGGQKDLTTDTMQGWKKPLRLSS